MNEFKNRLVTRIGSSNGFELIHTNDEVASIISEGRKLGLADDVIEDLLYISCRNDKLIKEEDLMQQMDNYVNVFLKRGFNSKADFDTFSRDLKNGLNDIGISTTDVRIQGSVLRTPSANDVEIYVMVLKEANLIYHLDLSQ